MALHFEREHFDKWVTQGLKISHGINLDFVPIPNPTHDDDHEDEDEDEEYNSPFPFLLPTAPVAFSLVLENDDVEFTPTLTPLLKDFTAPAMIPLPMNNLSVMIHFYPDSLSFLVTFKISWSFLFVKSGKFGSFFFAFPLSLRGPDPLAAMRKFKLEINNCPDEEAFFPTRDPMFDNVFFVQRNKVDGGAEIAAEFSYIRRISPQESKTFSINVPLTFPFYANDAQGDRDREGEMLRSKRCRIGLNLSTRESQFITNHSINYPLKVISKEEGYLGLLQDSEGPCVEWPNQDLHCTFTLMAKEATEGDKTTSMEPQSVCAIETAEPQSKKARHV